MTHYKAGHLTGEYQHEDADRHHEQKQIDAVRGEMPLVVQRYVEKTQEQHEKMIEHCLDGVELAALRVLRAERMGEHDVASAYRHCRRMMERIVSGKSPRESEGNYGPK